MGHKCYYEERIDLINNQLVCIIKACYGEKRLDILKIFEDGNILVNECLQCKGLGGYYVSFPGEKVYLGGRFSGYSYFINEEPEWYKIDKIPNLWVCNRCEINYDYVLYHRPELKYFINKIRKHNVYGFMFIRLLMQYKKNPNIESLIDLGYFRLALNNSLQRLSKKKMREVIKFIKDNPKINEFTQLKTILQCIKHNCSLEDHNDLVKVNFDKRLFKVLKDSNVSYSYYYDYLKMVNKVGHDINDEYWKYPSNLIDFHNRVMNEKKILDKTKDAIKELRLKEVMKNISKYNCNIDGYDVFVPVKYSDYEYVCSKLHQCLIRCDYIENVIKQKEVIVFIWKAGIPVATAEVFYNKKIGQFYGDERDRNNCKPTDEVKEVLNKYLEQVVLKKRKVDFNNIDFIKKKNECCDRMVGVV